jgi:hypothetical protein
MKAGYQENRIAGSRISEKQYNRTAITTGYEESKTEEKMERRKIGQKDSRTAGHQDSRSAGLQRAVQQDSRRARQKNSKTA